MEIIDMHKTPQNYAQIQEVMAKVHADVCDGLRENTIIVTRFAPIRTTGRCSPVEGFVTDTRGGGPTFHDPGQIVIYPIVRCVPEYTMLLQNCLKATISSLGFDVLDMPEVGVWVKKDGVAQKVAFIGAQVKKRVTLHGCSVNLDTDLSEFKKFDPCGLKDVIIGNLLVNFDEFISEFVRHFTEMYGLSVSERCVA